MATYVLELGRHLYSSFCTVLFKYVSNHFHLITLMFCLPFFLPSFAFVWCLFTVRENSMWLGIVFVIGAYCLSDYEQSTSSRSWRAAGKIT